MVDGETLVAGVSDEVSSYPARVPEPPARPAHKEPILECATSSMSRSRPETTEGDFIGLKDIHQGTGTLSDYQPSNTFRTLAEAYQYWIAYADVDGFRVDTAKHIDLGATRFFTSAIHEFAQTIGKDSFFLVGEITGPRGEAIKTRDETGLDAALGLGDVQQCMVDAVKGWGNPANYFELFRNSAEVDKPSHTWFRNHVVTAFDDHDLVRLGKEWKARFAADQEGRALESPF
jgi:hypothetical protein